MRTSAKAVLLFPLSPVTFLKSNSDQILFESIHSSLLRGNTWKCEMLWHSEGKMYEAGPKFVCFVTVPLVDSDIVDIKGLVFIFHLRFQNSRPYIAPYRIQQPACCLLLIHGNRTFWNGPCKNAILKWFC